MYCLLADCTALLGCACNCIAYYLCASHAAVKTGIVFSGVCLSVCAQAEKL